LEFFCHNLQQHYDSIGRIGWGLKMNEDQKSELKAWIKPEVIDVDADTSDVMGTPGPNPEISTMTS